MQMPFDPNAGPWSLTASADDAGYTYHDESWKHPRKRGRFW